MKRPNGRLPYEIPQTNFVEAMHLLGSELVSHLGRYSLLEANNPLVTNTLLTPRPRSKRCDVQCRQRDVGVEESLASGRAASLIMSSGSNVPDGPVERRAVFACEARVHLPADACTRGEKELAYVKVQRGTASVLDGSSHGFTVRYAIRRPGPDGPYYMQETAFGITREFFGYQPGEGLEPPDRVVEDPGIINRELLRGPDALDGAVRRMSDIFAGALLAMHEQGRLPSSVV